MAGLGQHAHRRASIRYRCHSQDARQQDHDPGASLRLLPAARREINYKEVGEIDFPSVQTKRKNLEESIASGLEPSPLAASPRVREPRKVVPPSDAELETFFRYLAWVTQSLLCYRSCHRTVMDLFLSRHRLSIRKCCMTYSETTTTSRHFCAGTLFVCQTGCLLGADRSSGTSYKSSVEL